ncbi:hypothetical protein NDU88_006062 [Pleurodeles waltl]|uniref:Uncharacterized protein n=1 Tax=Pleurodeles waltl TaxID=8319 RepID=A0AAV7L9B6_PLEWA|nr:hypothetical protein NDU88_006062 [Pleurodeles waltl]
MRNGRIASVQADRGDIDGRRELVEPVGLRVQWQCLEVCSASQGDVCPACKQGGSRVQGLAANSQVLESGPDVRWSHWDESSVISCKTSVDGPWKAA